MPSYLCDIRPSASLFSLIKFRLGGHSLRVETDRWLRPKPPREQRICRHCSMQAVEDEQHFLFDCPFYSIFRGQHFSLFGPNYQQWDLRLFFEQNSHQVDFVAHHIHLCFQARTSDESQLAPLAECGAACYSNVCIAWLCKKRHSDTGVHMYFGPQLVTCVSLYSL